MGSVPSPLFFFTLNPSPFTYTCNCFDAQAFIDFRMRRSLAKVIKIRRDRASLPIAAYENVIMRAVASNPCVLVAGDTGCGKSTQVLLLFLLLEYYVELTPTEKHYYNNSESWIRISYEAEDLFVFFLC